MAYHSITFKDLSDANAKNTYTDWHLVPASRPTVSMPEQKTNYISLEGSDGHIDLSESLTGYPLFNNREGSFDFYVLNEGYTDSYTWIHRYQEIANYLHGKKRRMYLEDDTTQVGAATIHWYYEGRFTVEWNSDQSDGYSRLTISYSVEPYKISDIQYSETRTISALTDISISDPRSLGATPIQLWIGSGITYFKFTSNSREIEIPQAMFDTTGYKYYPGVVMYGGSCTIRVNGSGTLKAKANGRSL